MAKKKSETPTQPPAPSVDARGEIDDLPVISWLGWHRTPKGYVLMTCKTQGRSVLEEDIISGQEPVSRTEAENRMRVEVLNRYILPRGDN